MSFIAVFDTNILLSGIGWRGSPYHCLELARNQAIEGVVCQELLDELTRNLQIKLKFSESQIIEVITDLLSFLRLVTIHNSLKVISIDPSDNKVLECAVNANADYIISGDHRHLLPLKNYNSIQIITANEFLTIFSHLKA
jgi:uncharacterized protein